MKKILLILIAGFLFYNNASATATPVTWTAVTGTNLDWNSPSTWTITSGSSTHSIPGAVGTTVTNYTDNVVIPVGSV